MDDKLSKIADVSRENEAKSLDVLNKLAETARTEAVFSKPIQVGDTQVITASEIQVGLGFAFGLGRGPHYVSNLPEESVQTEEETGYGTGGGGGGGASGRPVAVIIVREDGIMVEPILDTTKITLAFFTMLGSIFFLGAQMKKYRVK
jgi:uncharacterized spore protein YtfJ